ncbi:MAG: DUF2779 domain-containing protein [Campylobacterota bacterium]|nr:DUF2779 domain-containing protein [Campylobacterota bacterium]
MKLSKSLYTRGLQCSKSLWLKKYNKDALTKPDKSAQAVFQTGDEVGGLACELFPNGKEIPFEGTTFEEKIALTKQWMDEGLKNIYEATFEYDDILVMVDILHINDDNSVEIYEVKSSTEVKDAYLDDASIQYYVLNGLGYVVKKTSIVHINNNYVRDEELELDKLFTIADVSSEIVELQVNIPTNLKHLRDQLSKDTEPQIDIGVHCTKPYACDAINHCWKDIPEYSIFNIAFLKTPKKFELLKQGIVNFTDIEDMSIFTQSQQVQIASEQEQKTIINKEAIKEFVEGLSYPIYHLDFETFQQAVPKWKGIIPYMQIPFQFSLHIEQQNKDLEHKEFLAVEGIDPRYELAKRLVADIPDDVTVLAYNMGFEKGVIRKLADMFDEFASHLVKIHDNIQDLMTPFQKKDYYTPSMKGSYSIKYVLPALVPEMAKAYEELNYIQNGGDAMQTYPLLTTMEDKEEVKKLREALLKYCELDTLAMVKVLDKLKESV